MTGGTVLVAYGTTRGSTSEIAEWIAQVLRETGVDAEAKAADEVAHVAGYRAVVLGGAIYMGRWHRAAQSFTRRHRRALRQRPVWLFSSGPLDDSAEKGEVSLARGVARAMARTGARQHVTFGGRLAADPSGFVPPRSPKTTPATTATGNVSAAGPPVSLRSSPTSTPSAARGNRG